MECSNYCDKELRKDLNVLHLLKPLKLLRLYFWAQYCN